MWRLINCLDLVREHALLQHELESMPCVDLMQVFQHRVIDEKFRLVALPGLRVKNNFLGKVSHRMKNFNKLAVGADSSFDLSVNRLSSRGGVCPRIEEGWGVGGRPLFFDLDQASEITNFVRTEQLVITEDQTAGLLELKRVFSEK